jgi:epoxyqueuosine reductase
MSGALSTGGAPPADAAGWSAWLKEAARAEGAALAGIADPRRPVRHASLVQAWTARGLHGPMAWWPRGDAARLDPRRLLPSARSLLMVALPYDGRVALPAPPRRRISRYALGRDYHKVLKRLLRGVVQRLEEARGPVAWRACVDTAPLLERYWAWQAGLGWIGKNCLLIHPRLGSWFFLGGLLLDLELEPDAPHPERCGRCTACLAACPTAAFVEPGCLDAGRCISAQTIENRRDRLPPVFDPMPGSWLFGCDECQSCCPWNRRAGRGTAALAPDPALLARLEAGDWPDDDTSWEAITRGKALRRMTPAMYRRNLAASAPSSPGSPTISGDGW